MINMSHGHSDLCEEMLTEELKNETIEILIE
jgi:hypothetical protein